MYLQIKHFIKIHTIVAQNKTYSFRDNCVANLEFILCLYLETKYSIALSSNSCGTLVYKLHTSKLTKTLSSLTFRSHVFKKSLLSLMLLLTCLLKDFKIRFNKSLSLLVGNFGTPIIALSFKSLGYEMVISSSFLSLIAFCKFSNLRILRWP